MVPAADNFYGGTSFGNFRHLTWPEQQLSIRSPTPFFSFPKLSGFTGYQQGTACNSLTVVGTASYTSSFRPENPLVSGGHNDVLIIDTSPAFIYDGEVSQWLNTSNSAGGEVLLPLPGNLSALLQEIPAIRSQLANFSSMTAPDAGAGAPTALVSVAEVTAPSSMIIRMPGNYPATEPKQLTHPTTTTSALQTSQSETDWTFYPTSTITESETPSSLQSNVIFAAQDVSSSQPDSTASTSPSPILTATQPALVDTLQKTSSVTVSDEGTGRTLDPSSIYSKSTVVANVDGHQQTNVAPASGFTDNSDSAEPSAAKQSVVSATIEADVGDIVT
ncbi:hypothetical protein MBLNU457_6735t2 [Dothideomycetes sp. NU457]